MEKVKEFIEKLEELRAELDEIRFYYPDNLFLLNADNELCFSLSNLDEALKQLAP